MPLGFLSAPHPLCASLFSILLKLDDSLFFSGSADSGLGLPQVFCYCSGGIATLVSVVWCSCAYGRTHALRHHPLSPLPPSTPEYEHSSPPRLAHFEHTVSSALPFPARFVTPNRVRSSESHHAVDYPVSDSCRTLLSVRAYVSSSDCARRSTPSLPACLLAYFRLHLSVPRCLLRCRLCFDPVLGLVLLCVVLRLRVS